MPARAGASLVLIRFSRGDELPEQGMRLVGPDRPGLAGPNDRMPSGSPLAREPPELAKSRPAEGALRVLVCPGRGDEFPE